MASNLPYSCAHAPQVLLDTVLSLVESSAVLASSNCKPSALAHWFESSFLGFSPFSCLFLWASGSSLSLWSPGPWNSFFWASRPLVSTLLGWSHPSWAGGPWPWFSTLSSNAGFPRPFLCRARLWALWPSQSLEPDHWQDSRQSHALQVWRGPPNLPCNPKPKQPI